MVVSSHLNVPLLLTVGRMHAHLLDAHQILAGGNLSGKTELKVLHVTRQPALIGSVPRHHCAKLIHLEPLARAIIVAYIPRGFGEIDL